MKKIFLLIILLSSLFLVGCINSKESKTPPEDLGLMSVTSKEDLKNLIEIDQPLVYYKAESGRDNSDLAQEDAAPEYESSDYTKTNVQVEGVDEGDIMKTDGSRIYTISYDRLQVINLLGEGKMELLLSEQLTSDVSNNNYYSYTYYSELYLTEDYFIVIGQKYSYSYHAYDSKWTNDVDSIYSLRPLYYYTTMSIINIYDKQNLEKVDTYEVSGYLQGSRLIENKLYLISNYYVYYTTPEEFDIRPWYRHNDETSFFAYEDIKYIPDTIHKGFTVISTLNLEKEITINNNIFLSSNSWGQIYVSTTGIYFATDYATIWRKGEYDYTGIIVSYQFDEETGQVYYGGAGTYLGNIINQFAIDEYDNYLRLATTTGWGDSVVNRLYVFKRNLVDKIYRLEKVSLLDKGLGKPGERIQSVRFNKDIATIVTFLRTDPFYVIDLSDPYNPVIAGELEIPGYSTYQHPWTDDLVIGIGFDAVDGVVTGMKISLYDISDINNPIEVGEPLIFTDGNSSWSFSEATYNHKAVMIDQSRNCFGFSMWRYNWTQYNTAINDYLVFDVDVNREQPIQIKHAISHSGYQKDFSDLYPYYYYYNFQIKRAFRVDDYLYVISDEVITSHNLSEEIQTIDEIIFRSFYTTDK